MATINEFLDLKMPDAPNVSASNTVVFQLPIGRKYHTLFLTLGGTAPALGDIDEIRVMANGKPIHRYSATERDVMNQFDGRAAWHASNNPHLVIPFERFALENSVAEQETALDTGELSRDAPAGARRIASLTLEIDTNSGWPGDGSMKLWARQTRSMHMGAGTVMHVMKDIRDAAGAGEYEFSDLYERGVTRQALNRVFMAPSANDISLIKLDKDDRTIFERTPALNNAIQADGVRVPQAGYHVIDRNEDGKVGNRIAMPGTQDYRYKLTLTGAATMTFLHEWLGSLGD